MLVVALQGSSELYLRKVDVEKLMEEADFDYLFVESSPPSKIPAGELFEYQIEVKSKRGGVKFSLEAGPEGLKISERGKLTWQVPYRAEGKVESVITTISDDSGQQKFFTFKLQVE